MRVTVLYFGIGLAVLATTTSARPAQAQAQAQAPAREEPAARAAAGANVGRACRTEMPRFCAGGDGVPRSGRNAVICLRPYRTSLSLRCRAAVNEALRGATPG